MRQEVLMRLAQARQARLDMVSNRTELFGWDKSDAAMGVAERALFPRGSDEPPPRPRVHVACHLLVADFELACGAPSDSAPPTGKQLACDKENNFIVENGVTTHVGVGRLWASVEEQRKASVQLPARAVQQSLHVLDRLNAVRKFADALVVVS